MKNFTSTFFVLAILATAALAQPAQQVNQETPRYDNYYENSENENQTLQNLDGRQGNQQGGQNRQGEQMSTSTGQMSTGQMQMPQPQKEHEWLKRFVGEWDTKSVMNIPGQPPKESNGTESASMLGDFWVQGIDKGEMNGQPYVGHWMLGYDPQKGRYVGIWVNSMSPFLYTYEGNIDQSGNVLTLEGEGYCPMKQGMKIKFRDRIEFRSNDQHTFTSMMQDEKGEWAPTIKIEYTRAARR